MSVDLTKVMIMDKLNVDIEINYKDPFSLRKKLMKAQANTEWYLLALKTHQLQRIGAIDKLKIEDLMRTKIDIHNFQMQTALKVLNQMHGLALLADEVGLGKTIEAGLILKELIVREMVRTILICCPATLVPQWKEELSQKFGETFVTPEDDNFSGYASTEKFVCSIARVHNHIEEICSREWDMVVIDEAHILANTDSKRRKSIASIAKRHQLLLTATPIQNKLEDLYSLIDLLYPGLLGTKNSFLRTYAKDFRTGRVLREDTASQLRSHLARVMCRTRREESGIPFVKRHVLTKQIRGNKNEYKLIDEVTAHMAKIYGASVEGKRKFLLLREVITLQQTLSSSPSALIAALENRARKHPYERKEVVRLIEIARSIKHPSKTLLLQQVLDEVPKDQAIIFTIRRETANYLKNILNEKGNKTEVYMGGTNKSSKRDEIIKRFKAGEIQYIVATDAAAEGLNLQNCNILINYDLHWNPMKIEQRIGRIHRFGQEREVTVFNLALEDTIDEYVIKILFTKLDLFKEAIGGLEAVLGELKSGDEDLEKVILDIVLRSKNKVDIKEKLTELAKDAEVIAERQKLAVQFTKGVLG